MSDKTNPKHYQLRNGFQVIDLTETLPFCEGNVVKYVARAGKKDGESRLDDLKKAKYYLERAIAQETSGPDELPCGFRKLVCGKLPKVTFCDCGSTCAETGGDPADCPKKGKKPDDCCRSEILSTEPIIDEYGILADGCVVNIQGDDRWRFVGCEQWLEFSADGIGRFTDEFAKDGNASSLAYEFKVNRHRLRRNRDGKMEARFKDDPKPSFSNYGRNP